MRLYIKQVVGYSNAPSNVRVVASGTTVIAGASTVTLVTTTRNAGEVFNTSSFVTNNVAGASWSEGEKVVSGNDYVSTYFERTAVANQLNVKARNHNGGATSRTLDWAVQAFIP